MPRQLTNITVTTTIKFTLKERFKILFGRQLTLQTVSKCTRTTRVVHTDKTAMIHKPVKRAKPKTDETQDHPKA